MGNSNLILYFKKLKKIGIKIGKCKQKSVGNSNLMLEVEILKIGMEISKCKQKSVGNSNIMLEGQILKIGVKIGECKQKSAGNFLSSQFKSNA